MSYVAQALIIDNMNAYLKRQRMPSKIVLNKKGVCNGLAMLYGQYFLQGPQKEKEFFTLLNLIAQNKMQDEVEHGFPQGLCLHFASQILLAFDPSDFEQRFTQSTSMNMLHINKKTLVSSFDFALSTADSGWSEILSEIRLQHDEVMIVQSVNHAISIRKEGGGYAVYDPNYAEGVKVFNSEETLIQELHTNVFHYIPGSVGLTLHIVRHPDVEERTIPYPEPLDLYTRFLSIHDRPAKTDNKQFDTLVQAAGGVRDEQVIQHLITHFNSTTDELLLAAKRAIVGNNELALTPLLEALNNSLNNEQFENLVEMAVINGRLDAFNILVKDDKDLTYPAKKAGALILQAARGGNPDILFSLVQSVPILFDAYYEDIVLQRMEEQGINANADAILVKNVIAQNVDKLVNHTMVDILKKGMNVAVVKGNVQCIALFNNELKYYGASLDEKEWLKNLTNAMQSNQEGALNELIKINPALSKMLIAQTSMEIIAVRNTDLAVLQSLKSNGMFFSNAAEDVIKRKVDDSLLSLHTLLILVIGYIQELCGKTQISWDEDKLIVSKKEECGCLINQIRSDNPNLSEADEAFLSENERKLENGMDFIQISTLYNLINQRALKIYLSQFKVNRLEQQEDSLETFLDLDNRAK